MRTNKQILILPILVLAIFLSGCGATSFATNLRIVVAAGAPVLSVFVQQGKISPALKDLLTTDLNAEAGYISTLGTCFDAIPKDLPKNESKAKHLTCVQTFEGQTRPLLQKHFKTNEQVSFIADDIEAVIQAAIIFYGGVPTGGGQGDVPVVTEKDINERIARLKKDLGQ